jgi:hypothetical protein
MVKSRTDGHSLLSDWKARYAVLAGGVEIVCITSGWGGHMGADLNPQSGMQQISLRYV